VKQICEIEFAINFWHILQINGYPSGWSLTVRPRQSSRPYARKPRDPFDGLTSRCDFENTISIHLRFPDFCTFFSIFERPRLSVRKGTNWMPPRSQFNGFLGMGNDRPAARQRVTDKHIREIVTGDVGLPSDTFFLWWRLGSSQNICWTVAHYLGSFGCWIHPRRFFFPDDIVILVRISFSNPAVRVIDTGFKTVRATESSNNLVSLDFVTRHASNLSARLSLLRHVPFLI